MDRDRQRPELYGDFSDGPPPPPPPHPPLNSGDGDYHHNRPHHHHRHHSNSSYNHQHNFNSEQHGSFPGYEPHDNRGRFPRKRPFLSPDCIEGGSYVKLYVGGIPRTSAQEEVRSLFEEYGRIVEVVRLKDNRTYQPHECGFVKYATIEEADRAIGALDNKYTFPAGVAPIKVRYADGERERLGALGTQNCKVYAGCLNKQASKREIEGVAPIKVRYADGERERLGALGTQNCKVYVGCLSKQASKREIEEIFSPYGIVESVYIVYDEVKQSRGCGFIQFSHRDMAVAAINALSGTYIMKGCDQPLVVRFAEPKKPRIGEPRDSCKYSGSRPQEFVRPAPYVNGPRTGHHLPDASLPLSPKTKASSSQSPGTGGKPPTASRTSSASELVFPSTSNPLDCDWSEHTCPDGYKYYYNCETCESRWEKPEEYLLFEQKQLPQQMQLSSHRPVLDQMQVQPATTPTSVIISPTCV